MRLLILGVPGVEKAGGSVDYIEGAQAVILGELLAAEGGVVAADRLIGDVYGDDAPRNPLRALHAHMARLRRQMGQWEPEGPGAERLVTRQPGYVLEVSSQETDFGQFLVEVARARRLGDRDRDAVIGILKSSLALWRGPVLDGVATGRGADNLTACLEVTRLEANGMLADALLGTGRYAEAVAHLEGLLREHPCHERFAALQMTALARLGREHDAVRVYRRLRQSCQDELGAEPSEELAQLLVRMTGSGGEPGSPPAVTRAPVPSGPGGPRVPAQRAPAAPKLLSGLADAGSFLPLPGALGPPDGDRSYGTLAELSTGVAAGLCRVDGRVVAVIAGRAATPELPLAAQDLTGMLRTLEHAGRAGIPVLFLALAGAVLHLEEPCDFEAYAAVIGAAVRLKGVVPRIAIKQGNDAAICMDMAMVSDFIVHVRGGSEDPAEVRCGTGVVVRDRAEAVTFTRRILACLPGGKRSVRSRPATSFEELRRAAPLPFGKTDPREAIEAVVDGGSSLELMTGTGPGLITSLARLKERPIGVIAHDVLVGGGALTSDAVEKGTRMTRLCSRWGIPMLVLVHAPEPATMSTVIDPQEAGLLHAFAAMQVPRVTLVIGRTANATRWIMNSRATGATAVLAWPDTLGQGEQAGIDAVITPTRTRNVLSTLL